MFDLSFQTILASPNLPSPTPDFKSFVVNDYIEYMLNQLLDYIATDYAITKMRIYNDKVLELWESFLFNRDPSQG